VPHCTSDTTDLSQKTRRDRINNIFCPHPTKRRTIIYTPFHAS